jgi:hypothetical protein
MSLDSGAANTSNEKKAIKVKMLGCWLKCKVDNITDSVVNETFCEFNHYGDGVLQHP